MRVIDLESIRIKLASPDDILSWSHGEITKPETINYRTQKPEKDGLFCEKIFGPEKDYECYCGKYRRIRYKGIICDKCGVEVTKSSVRRERMGHIKLAASCSHIWFLRGMPSRMGMVIDIPMQQLERVIYFASYIITKVNEDAKKKILDEIEREFKEKVKNISPRTSKKSEKEKKSKKDSEKKESKGAVKNRIKELTEAKDKAKEEVSNIKPLKILSEVDYHNLSLKYGECFEAGTGAETLRKIFEGIDLKKLTQQLKKETEETEGENKRKILRRLKIIESMLRAQIRPEWMFLTVLPVLPPDLRPMVQIDGGRYASSDLNDLYRRVINRNNRLNYLLEISAPEVIVRNEKRMLQEAVDALIDNNMRKAQTTQATTGGKRLLKSLADILKGKQGRFRQNLLGKRVDYSGRSVIVVGPELKHFQVGLPKKMALELFKPLVIKNILEKELAYNIKGASRLIEAETDEVWAILEEIVKDKLVLLNRAPTLHRLGIQAFQPVLIEGEAIRIPPMVCKAFNADFDGDQMAVHVPLSSEAQKEAKEIMLSTINLLKPATGTPIVSPTQDIILGCYYLTKIFDGLKGEGKIFGSAQESLLVYDFGEVDLKAKIKVQNPKTEAKTSLEFIETSVGRIIFNQVLPKEFPYINEVINSKKLDKLISQLIEKYGTEYSYQILDQIKELGFEYATKSGVSWGMDDLIVPAEKEKLIEDAEKGIELIEGHFNKGLLSKEERSLQIIEVWQKTKSEIEKLVPKTLPINGSVFSIIDSGAKGSWSQPIQMAGMKGLVINPAGQIIELPVKSSFKEGFDVLEYFISTHGARKGTADTALRTSTAGYLTRRLIDVSHEVVVREEDCKTEKGILLSKEEAKEIGQDFSLKIVGRVALEDINSGKRVLVKKDEIINWEKAREIESLPEIKEVKTRSPLNCNTSFGVCQKCYGWDLGRNSLVRMGQAVGIVAAQAIGEPGTQLTMRTFHTGGVAGGADITQGLPRVDEVFEVRPPVGKATLSEVDGEVEEIIEENQKRIIKIRKNEKGELRKKKKPEIIDYLIPPKVVILVEKGKKIEKGQQLSEGPLDLKELFKIVGTEETKHYIIKEIQKIYCSQGAIIHDKHVEIIVRQMFSRVRIKEQGGSHFVPGEIVDKSILQEENNRLKKEGKEPAISQPLLLGISKVSLTCDSFLSAASFQETSRVLIRAAIEGKEDKLRGLKENVIIGKLIPVGTGFKK